LNGCDSRYLVIQLLVTNLNQTNVNLTDASVLPYLVIGGDQGLTNQPRQMTTLIVEPSARLDLIVNFRGLEGKRILMKNMGGDKAFGGNIPGPQIFEHTDKIMALDVTLPLNTKVLDSFDPNSFHPVVEALPNKVDRVRRLGLFEGTGFFGRHQPLLGTVEPAINPYGNPIHWPKSYHHAGLIGTMTGSMSWHDPVTEIVRLGDTEDWQLFNLSPDAHPIHLHLVNFTVVSRRFIQFDSNANDHGKLEEGSMPKGDGTYFVEQATLHHDGKIGQGWRAENPTIGDFVNESSLTEYNDNLVRDVVTVLPGQVTTIRARFERPGRFNWHCHMMSHEDDEMMRLYYVEEAPNKETKSLRRDGTNERSPRRHNKLFLESILGHIKEMSFGG
jgi:FtsP/CotA-like multicopper oxidase with cupredoxin domain